MSRVGRDLVALCFVKMEKLVVRPLSLAGRGEGVRVVAPDRNCGYKSMQDKFAEHLRVVEASLAQVDLLEKIAARIIDCFRTSGRLYLFGNGGSAADAQHIAAELVGRFKKNRKALPAIALTTDTSTLTAVSNDMTFEQIFSRQVEALVTSRDCVWALSVSGRSPNVLRALEAAKKIGATRIGFTSETGLAMADLCDLCFRVPHSASDRVQEVHLLAYHLICEKIEESTG